MAFEKAVIGKIGQRSRPIWSADPHEPASSATPLSDRGNPAGLQGETITSPLKAAVVHVRSHVITPACDDYVASLFFPQAAQTPHPQTSIYFGILRVPSLKLFGNSWFKVWSFTMKPNGPDRFCLTGPIGHLRSVFGLMMCEICIAVPCHPR